MNPPSLLKTVVAFVVFAISSIDIGFSQVESESPVLESKIVGDAETEISIEDTEAEVAEFRKEIEATWQRELKHIVNGELVLARLACGLTPEQLDTLRKSMQPRLEGMNDLIVLESIDGNIGEGFVNGVAVIEAQIVGPVDIVIDSGDEARPMENELDEVRQELIIENTSSIRAYTGNGTPLKENPYTRLRREVRESLREIASVEQLENYDKECLARDQYRKESTINLVMNHLQKTLLLEENQENQLRKVLANSIKHVEDLDLSLYVYDTNIIPMFDADEAKRLLTVRQRVKWNTLSFHNFPMRMPYFDTEPIVDE